jgi:hypothetical protein
VSVIKHHYEFVDLDSGEKVRGACIGSGSDSQDKGPYKAITGAIKYLMTTTFLIPTGDDPEGDGGKKRGQAPQRASGGEGMPAPRQAKDPAALISEPQQKRLFALMHKASKTPDQVKAILARFGYASSKDVQVGRYEAICAEVERKD